jgi:cysteine synthase
MDVTYSVTDLKGDTPLLRTHRLAGPDDAPVLHIVLQKAESLGKGKRIVAVLPDDGMKYLSTNFYDRK